MTKLVLLVLILLSLPFKVQAEPTVKDIRKQPFMGGSLVFDADASSTQLVDGIVIPVRLGHLLKGKRLTAQLPSTSAARPTEATTPAPQLFDLKDDATASQLGLLTVASVGKEEVKLDFQLFDKTGSLLPNKSSFTLRTDLKTSR